MYIAAYTTRKVGNVKDELIQMEKGFWQAAGNAEFYRTHFAEDGHCVFAFGILDKDQTVAAIEAAEPWTTFEFGDVNATRITRGVATLTYTVQADRGGDPYGATISSVYVERDGGWRLVLHQQTPVAQ